MIKYRKVPRKERTGRRQKFELTRFYIVTTGIKPDDTCWIPDYVYLYPDGRLCIHKGYRWDGASFILARDTKKTLRATLVHDCGYQLIREGLLDMSYRKAFDKLMYKILVEDGIWKIEAKLWYMAVRIGGKKAAKKRLDK